MPIKRCSISFVTIKMPIKTTMRCHSTPTGMAKIKKCWLGCEKFGTHTFLMGMQNCVATLQNILAVFQNVKQNYHMISNSSGYISKKNENMSTQMLVNKLS